MANVLVVEDDPDVAETLTYVLRDEGHEVRTARDGKEGLAAIDAQLPDLVLLDVEMPILNGPDMAYQLFVNNCGKQLIPIVLLSGIANLREVARRVGTLYFHAKPFRIDVVIGLVERALRERRAPVPLPRAP